VLVLRHRKTNQGVKLAGRRGRTGTNCGMKLVLEVFICKRWKKRLGSDLKGLILESFAMNLGAEEGPKEVSC